MLYMNFYFIAFTFLPYMQRNNTSTSNNTSGKIYGNTKSMDKKMSRSDSCYRTIVTG